MQNIKLSKSDFKILIRIVYILVAMIFGYFFRDISPHLEKVVSTGLDIPQPLDQMIATTSTTTLLGTFIVTRIVDGDTIYVKDGKDKEDVVRLLAINTPEIHNASDRQICLGKIATEFTKNKTLNQKVDLYADETQNRRDKYGRLLAYLRLSNASSSTFFNEDLIVSGNAKVFYTKPATVMYSKYQELESDAKKKSIVCGIWNCVTSNYCYTKEMKKKLIFLFVFLFIFVSIVLFSFLSIEPEINSVQGFNKEATTTETIFEAIELKSQKDFKLIGKSIFTGSGFEPGFAFKINLAGTKFGVDLDSQYVDTKYVGYLDIVSQSTTTKVFAGKMLDKNDQVVDGFFAILSKVCTMPSGEDVPFTVDIKAGTEVLSGCAELVE